MDALVLELRRALEQHRAQALDNAFQITSRDPATRHLTRQDCEQLVRGFEAMLFEALEGRGDATERLFLQTAIPGTLASGLAPSAVVRTSAVFTHQLLVDLLRALPEPARPPATEWLTHFFSAYLGKVTQVCCEWKADHG